MCVEKGKIWEDKMKLVKFLEQLVARSPEVTVGQNPMKSQIFSIRRHLKPPKVKIYCRYLITSWSSLDRTDLVSFIFGSGAANFKFQNS